MIVKTNLKAGRRSNFNPQPEPPGDLGTFGLASLQVGRVTATYVGLPSDTGLPPGPCAARLTIYSGNGAAMVVRDDATSTTSMVGIRRGARPLASRSPMSTTRTVARSPARSPAGR